MTKQHVDAVTTADLHNQLMPGISRVIDAAVKRGNPVSEQAAEMRRQLEAMQQQESISAGVRNALSATLRELEHAEQEAAREIKQTAAKALVSIGNELGIPLQLRTPQTSSSAPTEESAARAGRMTKEEKDAYLDRIVTLAQRAGEAGISRSDVIEHTDLTPPQASNLLRQLVKEAELKQVGQKRDTRYLIA